jgi:hypothetical protein
MLALVAGLALLGCGGSGGSGPQPPPSDTFVPQSVFLGSCATRTHDCYASRQNSGFQLDVRALFEQSCTGTGDAYSSATCAPGGYARCCLHLTPSSEAAAVTKFLTCAAFPPAGVVFDVGAYEAGCTAGGGTPSADAPQL